MSFVTAFSGRDRAGALPKGVPMRKLMPFLTRLPWTPILAGAIVLMSSAPARAQFPAYGGGGMAVGYPGWGYGGFYGYPAMGYGGMGYGYGGMGYGYPVMKAAFMGVMEVTLHSVTALRDSAITDLVTVILDSTRRA